jgi:hypothetical protein
MNDRIRQLLDQIAALDDELRTALHEQEGQLRYKIEGRRIAFEQSIQEAHAKLRQGALSWLFDIPPQNLLTAPIIYSLIVPLTLADVCVSFYQASCFPIYGIAKVRRKDYIVFDRNHLGYLNMFEKFHCLYCSYANGLLAYAREITARTEQYFCPIKHARKVLHSHERYAYFLDYGAADEYHARLTEFRAALAREKVGEAR